MNTNAIEKIRNAEADAELIEKAAAENAERIIEKAKKDAAEMVSKAKSDGLAKVEAAVADAKSKAEDMSEKGRDALTKELKALEDIAEKKQSDAVELIKKKLISD